jgi:hypothetical protein
VPISELVFGTLTQNRSSLEPSLEFAAIAGPPYIVIVHDTYKLLKVITDIIRYHEFQDNNANTSKTSYEPMLSTGVGTTLCSMWRAS